MQDVRGRWHLHLEKSAVVKKSSVVFDADWTRKPTKKNPSICERRYCYATA